MEYKNSKVTDEILPEGVTQLYQGHIVHSDAVGNDVLGQRIARRLKIDPAVACNILGAYATEFLDAVEAGERPVMDGVFTTRFTCDGAFDAEDDVWKPGRNAVGLAIVTLDPVKGAAAGIVPTNVLGKVTVQLLGSQDATTREQNAVTKGHALLCQGVGLNCRHQASADEGLFVVDADGAEHRLAITDCTKVTLDATVPDDVPAGTYRLEVRSRAGEGANRSLVTARIANFTVKAA